MITTKAVMDSLPENIGAGPFALAVLERFRREFHACLAARADELTELADAVLCADGPVRCLAGLSLAPGHRRGHGALYDAVNSGRIEIARLRRCLAGLPLPRAADGRLMLAVDVSNWLRPGAATSPDRLFCHVYGRGKGQAQMIPGWPYSVVAALEPGRTSWTAVLDAIRLGPADDEAEVTAAQVREVITRLIDARHWRDGDPPILVIFDAGYDPMRLAYQLAGLPVQILGRLRSDRVLHFPVPARQPGTNGRPPRHGREFAPANPATWPEPALATTTAATRYGTAVAQAWDRLHPRLTHRSAWISHDGPLPVIEGTLIRLHVDHLPGDRDPKPVWLWCSVTDAPPADVDRLWQAFLRRFDLEHTFRMFKQVLGWTSPKIRDPAAADRWTWIIIACHAQLRLARPLADDLRLPWERPAPPGRLTPARVRRGFRNIHATPPCLAGAPKPGKPGPGRTWPPSRVEEPAPGTPPRRGKDDEEGCLAQGAARTRRLNGKLRQPGQVRQAIGAQVGQVPRLGVGGAADISEAQRGQLIFRVQQNRAGCCSRAGHSVWRGRQQVQAGTGRVFQETQIPSGH